MKMAIVPRYEPSLLLFTAANWVSRVLRQLYGGRGKYTSVGCTP